LGLIPVLIVDYFDGRYFTAVSRYIQSDETSGNAGLKEIWKGMKVVALDWMHRKPKNVKENNNV
jgi:hypothetical protein